MKYILRLVLIVGALLLFSRLLTAEYVELSDYFAVKQASGLLVSDHQEIFARENKEDDFKLIGTTMPTNWDKPFSGVALEALQASPMALSTDGKTLLYRHRSLAPWRWHTVGAIPRTRAPRARRAAMCRC
jgi:hypothetical protein